MVRHDDDVGLARFGLEHRGLAPALDVAGNQQRGTGRGDLQHARAVVAAWRESGSGMQHPELDAVPLPTLLPLAVGAGHLRDVRAVQNRRGGKRRYDRGGAARVVVVGMAHDQDIEAPAAACNAATTTLWNWPSSATAGVVIPTSDSNENATDASTVNGTSTRLNNGIATRFTSGPTRDISLKYHAVSGSNARPIDHCSATNARAASQPRRQRPSTCTRRRRGPSSASKMATAANDDQNDAASGANGSNISTTSNVAASTCHAPTRRRVTSTNNATAIISSERSAGTAKPVRAA